MDIYVYLHGQGAVPGCLSRGLGAWLLCHPLPSNGFSGTSVLKHRIWRLRSHCCIIWPSGKLDLKRYWQKCLSWDTECAQHGRFTKRIYLLLYAESRFQNESWTQEVGASREWRQQLRMGIRKSEASGMDIGRGLLGTPSFPSSFLGQDTI